MEVLTNSLNSNNVPVGNTRANNINAAGVQGGADGVSGSGGQQNASGHDFSSQIAQLKKEITDTKKIVTTQGDLIKQNAAMAQKITKLNEQVRNFDAKLGIVNETKEKIRRDQEKEIIDNAHIDANKNAIQSKEREKERIQKILDTNNISDDAKLTLKKDMNRIDGEIGKTEAQNVNLKEKVNQVQNLSLKTTKRKKNKSLDWHPMEMLM